MAMDEMSKKMTEDLTGKPYEPGDLGIELDKRVKSSVASFAGKDEYELGDLTRYDSLFLDFTLSLCLFRRLPTSFAPCLSFIRLSSRATRTAISCTLFSAFFSPHAPLRPIDLNRTIAAHVMNRVEENSRANHMNSVIFRERWKNTENNRTSADTIVELGKGS